MSLPPTNSPSKLTDRQRLIERARAVFAERGFTIDFSADVVTAVARLEGPASGHGLVDLTHLPWCSIDNDDSRDLDQLTCGEERPEATRVHVAIADVDALVAKGGPVDEHARANTTSLYPPGTMVPMLPEALSTDLTSLNEGVQRAAVVVSIDVRPGGAFETADIRRAMVVNRAQLAYAAVGLWLEGSQPPPAQLARVNGLAANLRLQDAAARELRRRRSRSGALPLATVEPRAAFEEDMLIGLHVERRNRAHFLIEDFMIAANVAVATTLGERGSPSIRRVVKEPDRWDRIVELARHLGYPLPERPDTRALQAFLEARRKADPLRFADLSLTVVKLIGSGGYVTHEPGAPPTGHFGLALKDYAHSTAPNRRYPDLIVQRLLKSALARQPAPYAHDELEELATWCTEREDEAGRAERQLTKSAAALLLAEHVGDEFDAIVTGASSKGTWVRVVTPPVEGKLTEGTSGVDVGDRLRVRLLKTDFVRGHIDFARA